MRDIPATDPSPLGDSMSAAERRRFDVLRTIEKEGAP